MVLPERHCCESLGLDPVSFQRTHDARGADGGQLPVGGKPLGKPAANRHVIRVPLHEDLVRRAAQLVGELPENPLAFRGEFRRSRGEQRLGRKTGPEPLAKPIDRDPRRREVGLEIAHQTLVGRVDLVVLARLRPEVAFELGQSAASLLEFGDPLVALAVQTRALGRGALPLEFELALEFADRLLVAGGADAAHRPRPEGRQRHERDRGGAPSAHAPGVASVCARASSIVST
ncbi:MAG: hypothetical protein M5U32_10730 [Myxococcota bacterium]|nr:hypothetical protein [Myxococcota bacterium]